jgi:hypothetical protein
LLAKTRLPVTAIYLESGFTSPAPSVRVHQGAECHHGYGGNTTAGAQTKIAIFKKYLMAST